MSKNTIRFSTSRRSPASSTSASVVSNVNRPPSRSSDSKRSTTTRRSSSFVIRLRPPPPSQVQVHSPSQKSSAVSSDVGVASGRWVGIAASVTHV
jgi:hypothetical protein